MKKLLFLLVTALTFLSCKKETEDSCAELIAKRARISFENSGLQLRNNRFDICNTKWTYAEPKIFSGVVKDITVSAATGPTTDDDGAEIWIQFPISSDTSITTIDFSRPYTDRPFAMFKVGNPGWDISYTSKSGVLTITKLTENEIEGSFYCVAMNQYNHDSVFISNGTFAGKF